MPEPWATLSRRVVMVARYHERDGIARYAEQLAEAYGEGRTFVRVGILDGPGDHHRRFERGLRALWLLRDAGRSDDVVVHYHPDYFIRGGSVTRALSHLSWGVLGLLRRTTFVVHEFDPDTGNRAESAARRWAWRRAGRLIFHSEWQRDRHLERYGARPRQELTVVSHGDFFTTEIEMTRDGARQALDLPQDRTLLLMIGFISAENPDKGYDRALAAFTAADPEDTELRIVGSPIREGRAVDRLLERLRSAAASSPAVVLHEGFTDDREFDLWLRAADAVLAPYATASSSGVVARAHLLGTGVVMSSAGGLAEQAGPDDILFGDDRELAEAIARVARESAYARRASSSR